MFALISRGRFLSALLLAEAIVEREPQNIDALTGAAMCRGELRRAYLTRLGSLEHVPRRGPAVEPDTPALDAHAAALLARIDGHASIEQLISEGDENSLDTLRCLYELFVDGLIDIDGVEATPPSTRLS